MKFEYDPNKNQLNFSKHGIDFEQAQKLWQDPKRIELQANSNTEPRRMTIGKLQTKHWSAIYTQRNDKIRLISVRRSRPNEVNLYETQSNHG